MPLHLIERDLQRGKLLSIEGKYFKRVTRDSWPRACAKDLRGRLPNAFGSFSAPHQLGHINTPTP